MKKLMTVLLICVFLSGCGVTMNGAYKKQLAQDVELLKATHGAMASGNLTVEQATPIVGEIYVHSRMWQDAQTLNGVPSDEAEKEAYLEGLRKELE